MSGRTQDPADGSADDAAEGAEAAAGGEGVPSTREGAAAPAAGGEKLRVLGEWIVRRQPGPGPESDSTAAENPYWLHEEPAPHPDPSRGCIRRGLCCRTSPGWFAPGEVEEAAAVLGMEPDAFVRKYVVVDEVDVDGRMAYAFAPVKLTRQGKPAWKPGTRVDALYRTLRGVCVFFDGEGCRIYQARPAECRAYSCTNDPEDNLSHEELGRRWLEE